MGFLVFFGVMAVMFAVWSLPSINGESLAPGCATMNCSIAAGWNSAAPQDQAMMAVLIPLVLVVGFGLLFVIGTARAKLQEEHDREGIE